MPETFPLARVRADRAGLALARRMFFDEGRAPATLVPGAIIESWRRCQSRGQRAGITPDITPVTVHELNALLERNEGLRRVCRPEMEALGAVAKATQSVLVLTDPEGLVLETIGDMRFASRAASVSLRPGTLWSEANSGTNAIGTAILQGSGVVVRGGEHFHAPHHILCCAAMPIFNPRGAMIGVLDLTSPAAQAHPHTLGLVEMAVSQIEHRQFDHDFDGADVMVISREADLLGTAREGVLVFEGQRLVAASRTGLSLTGLDYSALGQLNDEDIFRERISRAPGDISLRGRANGRLTARFRPCRPRMVRGARLAPASVSLIHDTAFSQGLQRGLTWREAGLNLLISGPAGTGKTTLAEAIHAAAAPHLPLFRLNCTRDPAQTLAGSLGAAEHAMGGTEGVTLLIEEIAALSSPLQARLAALLEQSSPGKHCFIATTLHPPESAAVSGALRPDLHYALAQGRIDLAPLCTRTDLGETLQALLAPSHSVDDEALEALLAHDWPGNLRELSGVLRAMAALSGTQTRLTWACLPAYLQRRDTPSGAPGNLNALTLGAMQAALDAAGGNVSLAARQLGVDRTTLYRRLLWKGRPRDPA
jgi:sigma-54 dependent transcriptional regulator, acetoin dehydrogenase operon transcriptional activator AcoR